MGRSTRVIRVFVKFDIAKLSFEMQSPYPEE